MAKYLDKAGLKTTLTALRAKFAALETVEELVDVVEGLVDYANSATALLEKIKTADGAGSGLDADLLDGKEGDWFRKNGKMFTVVKAASNGGQTVDATADAAEGGLLSNYSSSNKWVNAPAGMSYGIIYTIKGENSTMPGQLAWDINHNSPTPTRNLWWRAGCNGDDYSGFQNDWHQVAFTDGEVAKLTTRQLKNEDLNDLRTPGTFYYGGSGNMCANKPDGVGIFGLQVLATDTHTRIQVMTLNNGSVMKRHYTSSVNNIWGPWVKMVSEDMLSEQTAKLRKNLGLATGHNIYELEFADATAFEFYHPSMTEGNPPYSAILTRIPPLNSANLKILNFSGGSYIRHIHDLDLPEATKVCMKDCSRLVYAPRICAPKATDISNLFNGCTSLRVIPEMFFGSVTNAEAAFKNCTALEYLPEIDLSQANNIKELLYGSRKLRRIERIKLGSFLTVSGMENVFYSPGAFTNARYIVIEGIGHSGPVNTLDLSNLVVWGAGSEENRRSLVSSLVELSYDRTCMTGWGTQTISLNSTVKARLTAEEIARITARGFTLA
ncbi:MAG: pyocin knob domain-containing protein [Muribaculaceae bacterium]|nr:pyocin knob domain-containing protein [Muribaculaceae bacterium]